MPRRAIAWIIPIALLLTACASPPAPPPRLTYDSHCYQIDGKDTFIYSAAFHYFRCPKPLWAKRFQTLKEAGFNTVETYVAWNWHERTPPTGPDDFSHIDMTDLNDWLDMAIHQFGFNVILRPGPYICAEWDGGGYPQWLITRRPASVREGRWLRSDDPVYLQWCRHWYQAVATAAAPYQITRQPAGKPGIILWQIENEYEYASFGADVKLHQIVALAHDARDFGIDVPLLTCMSDDPLFRQNEFLRQNVTECRNTYPGYDPQSELHNITMLDDYQPEKPKMITELQGGWFAEVGAGKKLSPDQGFTAEQIAHVTLLAWSHGYSGTNFYMAFGGTNFGDWAARNITTTYDYAAPVHEWGGIGPRYFAVKSPGDFVRLHGPALARSDPESIDVLNAPDDLTVILRRAPDGSRFLFLLNNTRSSPLAGKLHILIPNGSPDHITADYELHPFGASVIYLPPNSSQNESYPAPTPSPPAQQTASFPITKMLLRTDPGPAETDWIPLSNGQGPEDVGIFDRRFIWYRANLPPNSGTPQRLMLSAALSWADTYIAELDGKRLPIHRHGARLVGGWISPPPPGEHSLLILYENAGRANAGAEMEARSGLHDPAISDFRFFPIAVTDWYIRKGDGDWEWFDIADDPKQVKPQQTATLRGRFKLSPEDMQSGATILSIEHIRGSATLSVNGKDFGPLKRRQNLAGALKQGKNEILITIKATDSSAGIGGGAQIDSTRHPTPLPITWQISGQSTGLVQNWFAQALDESNWQSLPVGKKIPQVTADSISPIWIRLHFQIPDGRPWNLHLEAIGNGFIYLNGQPLGRYWQVGPQKDFYMPECWLNPGSNADNVVTLFLRPTDTPVALNAVSINPEP
jgi:hypothetical protein